MKKYLIFLLFLAVLATPGMTRSACAQTFSSIMLGARRHQPGRLASHLPYGRSDYSAIAALRFHDRDAWWQLGLGYAWDPSGSPPADFILTPQVHLFFKGNLLVVGLGAMKSYIRDDVRKDSWSPFYYDVAAGAEIPLGRLTLTALASYPFRKWADFEKLGERHLEYSAGLSYRF